MKQITTARRLIIDGHVSQACNLVSLMTLEHRNQVDLVHARFNSWTKSFELGEKPDREERNLILLSLLNIITEIEKNIENDSNVKFINELDKIEKGLIEDYEKYIVLKNKKKGLIDLFMLWMRKENSLVYERIVQQENILGKAIKLEKELNDLDMNQFIQRHNFNATVQQVIQYYVEENDKKPNFFLGWQSYNLHLIEEKDNLLLSIKAKEFSHWKLFGTSLLGGIIGASSIYLFDTTDFINEDDSDDELIDVHDVDDFD